MSKVVVGMSGGVDSSVAAYLLKKQGYDVIGVTMQIRQDEDEKIAEENGGCCGLSAVEDAGRVARELGIPYYVMNFKSEFKEKVIDYFVKEYTEGRTPNPCIACNRCVKWESLLRRSMEIGADYIATGHYSRIARLDNGRYVIRNSVMALKDQTYALYNLTQQQLSRTLMPVGDYTKEEIRKIAGEIGLNVAYKPDSQDICFVPDGDYAAFIKKENGYKEEGSFVDLQGNIIGRHRGIIHYTVGQRKGLGISAGEPLYVVNIRPETNEVVLGKNNDTFKDTVYADHINCMAEPEILPDTRLKGKIRYNHSGAECTVTMVDKDTLKCVFDKPQRAVTPGQALVLYKDDYVFGGGIIV